MIRRRQQSNNSYKKKTAKRLGPNGIVLAFIQAIDEVRENAKGPLDFEAGLEREAGLLLDRMRTIDPDVDIQISWGNENKIENWKELTVDGVLIKWSKFYLRKHQYIDTEKYIDVGSLFMEGYIAEDEPVDE